MSKAKKIIKKKKTKDESFGHSTKLNKITKSKVKKDVLGYKTNTKVNSENVKLDSLTANLPDDLPKEAREKLERIKILLDKYQKKIVSKFQGYIMGISLLPPTQPEKGKELTQKEKDAVNVLVLLDDVDSKKMSKEDLREKLSTIMIKTGEDIDKSLKIETLLITDLWQACSDGKYDILKRIALSAPIFDRGMLSAIKISEIHKQMVLEKFEHYIVSYCLAGSLVQGKAHSKSDIDVFIVIDDTDVKKMSRAELRDKLRAIIIGMGIDAGNMTGIKNKLNIQVYILTDFWDSIKEANPVIFTMLRDGIPLFDKGIFMPWKQLLQMGKIKPSPEAIDMYIHSGDQLLERVKLKLKEIGMEDFFWATLTPSQAALMMMGVAPPAPKESAKVMSDVFVKKEKLLEPEYVAILKKIVDTRKEMEYGNKTKFTGKEADEFLKLSEKYLKRLKKLFQQISEVKKEEAIVNAYTSLITIMRDILKLEKNIKTISNQDILKSFKENVVNAGLIPEKAFSNIKLVFASKELASKKKLSKHEVSEAIKSGKDAIKSLVDFVERKKSRELDKIKIKVKYGKKYGEVILLGKKVFIIHDLEVRNKVSSAGISKDGRFLKYEDSSLEKMEEELMKIKLPKKSFIKEKIFEDLKSIFGKDVEILLNS